jgi:hypothetical protein
MALISASVGSVRYFLHVLHPSPVWLLDKCKCKGCRRARTQQVPLGSFQRSSLCYLLSVLSLPTLHVLYNKFQFWEYMCIYTHTIVIIYIKCFLFLQGFNCILFFESFHVLTACNEFSLSLI